jgi:hypothetical protein
VIQINAADLSSTRAFNFGVLAASGVVIDAAGNPDLTNEHRDWAPDLGHGFWSYSLA